MGNQYAEMDLSEFNGGDGEQDNLFTALSDPRRRYVLYFLQTAETTVSVEELSRELVAWDAQRPAPERSGDERESIEMSLIHHHLPQMAQAGLITYDVTERTVTLADRADEVRAHLQIMTNC